MNIYDVVPREVKTLEGSALSVFTLIDGTLLIGYITDVTNGVFHVYRPYYVIFSATSAVDNETGADDGTIDITEYVLEPFLNQMVVVRDAAETHITTTFMATAIVAVDIPAQHLIRNYVSTLALRDGKELIDNEDTGTLH